MENKNWRFAITNNSRRCEMNSLYKANEDKNGFDFTATKIFLSVIAIFLSLTIPNALAIKEKSGSNRPMVLNKILIELKNRQPDLD